MRSHFLQTDRDRCADLAARTSQKRFTSLLSLILGGLLLLGANTAFAVANIRATLSAPAAVTVSAANNFTFDITANVVNSGTASIGTITFTSPLPTGLAFVAGSSPGGFACAPRTVGSRTVDCKRATSMPAASTDVITLTVKPSQVKGYQVSSTLVGGGGGNTSSNNITISVSLYDLAVASVGQPFFFGPNPANPALMIAINGLQVNAMSELPVNIRNVGNIPTPSPVDVSVFLPDVVNAAGQTVKVGAPLKFIYKNWVCRGTQAVGGTTVSCSRPVAILGGQTAQIQVPVTPDVNSLGTLPSFQATVATPTWDPNPANNGPLTTVAATAVTGLALTAYDPNVGVLAAVTQYSNVSNILNPSTIPKWQLELPNLAHPAYVHTADTTTYPGSDYYKLDVKQVTSQILPAGFPATPVLAYGDPARPDTYSFPAHTIVARSTDPAVNGGLGKPVKISYSSDNLLSANAALLPPVDNTIHGTNNGEPVLRTVTHLHGSKANNELSDGYPEAWKSPFNPQTFTPMTGMVNPSIAYNPAPFDYANVQESTMIWYHDHTLGMTHNNVYSGLAGAYLVRDDNEVNMMTTAAVANTLPHPNYEVPLVFQDRMFHTDGTLAYPDLQIDALTGLPVVDPATGNTINPSVIPEFFGQVMLVNGAAWPYLEVEPRKYRFRLLNGSNSRFYTFALSSGQTFQVLGSDEGFLNTAAAPVPSLTIAPGERYDVVIDFTGRTGQTITLNNSAPTVGVPVTVDASRIMRFRVNQPLSTIPDSLPLTVNTSLRSAALGQVPALTPTVTRQVLLNDATDVANRVMPSLGIIAANGVLAPGPVGWMDMISETPTNNTVEEWEVYNNTVDIHPIHLHGGHLQVVNRQPLNILAPVVDPTVLPGLITGAATAAPAQEGGWKDTFMANPFTVTRIRVQFGNPGLFVWHCHILEHEDHDMMRPLQIN